MDRILARVIAAAMILEILVFPAWGSGAKYELVASGGYVAVLCRESGILRRTDTRTALLPIEDQRLLQEGIPCEDGQRVLWHLENFCS